jgi:signal transduction histidine kinase
MCHAYTQKPPLMGSWVIMSAVSRPFRTGGPLGLDPVLTRRVIDAAVYLLAAATFARLGDTEILLHAMWVTIAVGAFFYGLRIALLRILIAAGVAVGYSAVALGTGQPFEIEPHDLTEWPLMVAISVVVAIMADNIATSAKRYATLYRQASDRLHTAHEEERARLARDLHDGVGQTITAVILALDAAEAALPTAADGATASAAGPIWRAQVLAASALEEARDVAGRLRPARIHEIGLGAALRNLGEGAGMPVDVRLEPAILPAGALDAEREIDAYRIVQEAIGNAAHHSGAEHVWIDGHVIDGQIRIEVGDDGAGFEPSTPSPGLGLDGMRDRAAILEAGLEIRSRVGEGTTVVLSMPYPAGSREFAISPAAAAGSAG